MEQQQKRGFLVTAGALITSAVLALGGATAANADTVLDMPDKSGIIITKLEQRTPAGEAATGLEIDTTGLPDAIPGVTFEAYEVNVPGFLPSSGGAAKGSNDWQQAIADVTLVDAQALIDSNDPVRTGETDANGQIFWQDDVNNAAGEDQGGDLPWGLYLIRETATPEGVVPSGDFLVAVPLTDPLTLDENGDYQSGLTTWLDDIYIYPKNATVEGTKTVENATDFAVGDTVTWTINAEIPQVRDHTTGAFIPTDRFDIHDTLTDDQLTLESGADSVSVSVPGGLTKGTGAFNDEEEDADYFVTLTPDVVNGTTLVEIQFTAAGREKLAGALTADPVVSNVTVTLDTVVESAGVIENEATVFPGGDSSYDIDPAEVRYGNITLKKLSTDEEVSAADRNGAEFRVYLTEEAAIAKSETPYSASEPNGYLTTSDNRAGLWITGADGTDGEVLIGGLRYSDYANGAGHDADENDIHQTYWLVEVKSIEGHQLLAEPMSFEIDSHDGLNEIQVTNTSNENGFVLPLTGGMGTAFLTIGGIAILAVVLFVARSRRNDEVTAE